MRLDGVKVLVTGGTRGIGAAMVEQLLAKGCTVLVVARASAALEAYGTREGMDILEADLADPDMPRAVANWVADAHPDCAVLINNAAVMEHTFLTRNAPAKMDALAREVALNLTAPMQLSALLLPVLARQPNAAIVNVTSGLALAPIPNAASYCATKAGLGMFTKALRLQCRAEGWPVQLTEAMMTLVDTTLSEGDPARKYPPERAAADVIAGVEAGRKIVYIEKVKILHRLWRLSPALAEWLMGRHSGAKD